MVVTCIADLASVMALHVWMELLHCHNCGSICQERSKKQGSSVAAGKTVIQSHMPDV